MSVMIQAWYLNLAVSVECQCCYEVIERDLGINFPAYQQAEDCEKGSIFSSSVNPWSRSMPVISILHAGYGTALFPLLGAERNDFGCFGIDYCHSQSGHFLS